MLALRWVRTEFVQNIFCPVATVAQHRKAERSSRYTRADGQTSVQIGEGCHRRGSLGRNRESVSGWLGENLRLRGGAVDGPDLVQQAIAALLQERRTWKPSQVNFVGLLTGAIRSIASNHKAKSLSSGYSVPESQIAPTDDGDESEALTSLSADSRPNQEQTMIQAEREAENVVLVEDLSAFSTMTKKRAT